MGGIVGNGRHRDKVANEELKNSITTESTSDTMQTHDSGYLYFKHLLLSEHGEMCFVAEHKTVCTTFFLMEVCYGEFYKRKHTLIKTSINFISLTCG